MRANGAVVDTPSVAILTCQCKPEAMHQTESLCLMFLGGLFEKQV